MKKKVFMLLMTLGLVMAMAFAGGVYAEEGEPAGDAPGPFFMQKFSDLYKAGKLTFPEGVEVTEDESAGGLLIKGKKEALAAGRITAADQLDFTGGTVGRIMVDGLGDRGLKVSAQVYLDDSTEAAAVFPLKNQMGKAGWSREGDRTADVLDMGITGAHSVSFSIVDESEKEPDKKITVLLRSFEFAQSTLPVLWFDIDESLGTVAAMNSDPDHNVECCGDMTVQIPDGYQCEYTDKTLKTQKLALEYIRGRGNSTWDASKKPYKVKLDKKTDLFGMGKNKHWILLANRYDNSFMRNKMTYWLGDQMGMEYTPQSVPVEVVMNGEFYGCYFLTEQIRIGEGRIEIDDLEDEDTGGPAAAEEPEITGGYLLNLDFGDPEEDQRVIETSRGITMTIERPSYEDYMNEAQVTYIKSYVQAAEDAVFGKDFCDESGRSYTEFLDMKAAVDYFWVQELSANGDAYGSGSTYLYKKRSGKLYWGPLWDFDYVAWGDLEYGDPFVEGLDRTSMGWFDRMRKDPAFLQLVTDRWPMIRDLMNEVTREGGLLDQYYTQLKTARLYDVEKYGSYSEDWGMEEEGPQVIRTYEEEVGQLRRWINARTAWIDANLSELIPAQYTVRFKAGKKQVKTKVVEEDEHIGTLPKGPAKKGYVFAGWYVYGGKLRLNAGSTIGQSVTAKARYIKKSKAVKAKIIYFKQYYRGAVVNNDFNIEYIIRPAKAYNRDIIWSSSDKNIATVDAAGTVCPHAPGIVTITASIKNGPKASCRMKVVKNYDDLYDPTGFKLNKTSSKIRKGRSTQIRATFVPKYCYDRELKWFSSDKKVAAVNQYGLVTGKKKGTAVIFAFDSENGTLRMCKVKVTR
ncbi:MAG: CotH kinase family protein [Lachnospiraceae bacterium]|nr:CotH kinase family protein [Lachnospiraceae bacterium]